MTIPLSHRTLAVIDASFTEPMSSNLKVKLLADASGNIPFHNDSSPEEMDRIRFAVIKLALENERNTDMAIRQAKTEWRDLFMMVGFACDAEEHNHWFNKIVTKNAE